MTGAGCGGPVDEERHARLVAEQNARYALRVGQAAAERCEELEAQVAFASGVLHEFVNVRGDFYEPRPLARMVELLAESLGVDLRYDWRSAIDRAAVAQQRAAETKEQPGA